MFTKIEALPGESFYAQVPAHWLRDPRASATLKAVLGYWQTHQVGYQVTIEQTIAEMKEGKSAIYAAVKHGIELGYLRRLQGRGDGGRGFGAVEYTFGPAAYEQQYVRNWGRRPDGTEGPLDDPELDGQPVDNPPAPSPVDNSATPSPVDNRHGSDVSAGQRAYRFSGSTKRGSTERGSTKRGSTSSASTESNTKKIKPLEDQSLSSYKPQEDHPPSLLPAEPALPQPRAAATGTGGRSEVETPAGAADDELPLLDVLVADVVKLRGDRRGWTALAIRRAVLAAAKECGSIEMAVAAARVCYARQGTAVPGRLPHDLDAWDAAARQVRAVPTVNSCATCKPYVKGQVWIDGDPNQPVPCSGCRPDAATRHMSVVA